MSLTTLTPWEVSRTTAHRIYDIVDAYAEDRGIQASPARPRGRLRFQIIATEAVGNRTELDDPLDLVMVANASGARIWFGLVRTPDGREMRYPSGPPTVIVRITSDNHQVVEDVFEVAEAATTATRVDLQPGYNYPFPLATAQAGRLGPSLLAGSLLTADGQGEAGVTIDILPLPLNQPVPGPTYLTGVSGRWVLPLNDAVASTPAVAVRIQRTGAAPIPIPEVPITAGVTASLRQASFAGSARRASGAPYPGVIIAANLLPGASSTTGQDGRFTLVAPIELFPPSGGSPAAIITATPPVGAAQQTNASIRPRATQPVAEFVFP